MNSWWTVGWVAWLAWFALQEGAALFNRQDGDTLSEHAWRWLHVGDGRSTALTIVGRAILAIGGVWLAGHLAMGWWTPTHPWPGT